MNLKELEATVARSALGADAIKDIKVLACYADQSLVVEYTTVVRDLKGRPYNIRRVCYITSAGHVKWNMIAE